MAKYRYRVEGGNRGGELVIGKVRNAFVQQAVDLDHDDLVERVLESEDWEEPEITDTDEHEDPEAVVIPKEDYYMWECDDIEHLNGPYADGGFHVYEVPTDESDDWDYEKEVWEGDAICMYSREGGYFGNEEPEEADDKVIPVLAFHSSEKGSFGCWFIDIEEPFDRYKLGFGIVETNLCELVDRVYYDKEELDTNYDYNDTTGKSYDAAVGWLNIKWHDSYEKYSELDEDFLTEFDDNVEYEKENGE